MCIKQLISTNVTYCADGLMALFFKSYFFILPEKEKKKNTKKKKTTTTMSQDTRVYMRRLEKIAIEIGVTASGKDPEPTVDTSGMSKYEKGRFHCAMMMKQVREDTKSMDDMQGSSVKVTKKAEVSNRLRRNLRQMKNESRTLKKEAAKEGRLDDFSDLVRHMKKTEAMYVL